MAFAFAVTAVFLRAQAPSAAHRSGATLPLKTKSVLAAINPANLRGDLSFLASDTLAGRYTPSPGLDVAAEFIASQFRAAGLDPGGDHDYFQVASMVERRLPKFQSALQFEDSAGSGSIAADSLSVLSVSRATDVSHSPVLVVKTQDPDLLRGADLAGKVVVAPMISFTEVPAEQRAAVYSRTEAFQRAIRSSNARLALIVGRGRRRGNQLLEENPQLPNEVPLVAAESARLAQWFDHPEETNRTVSVQVPAAIDEKVQLKNVIGVLRGSDPTLKTTCVLLTAHYDHIGTYETGRQLSNSNQPDPNDQIFNGANDDGSGTVSVIEIARALSKLTPRPKRSIVFITFFGEERGDIGSGFYGRHPIFPIANTVADLNLEQVGRTDSTEGKQVNTASVTGYDYSDVTGYLERAGRLTGVKVYMDRPASDDYFTRSDNASLAEQGVPAHTLTVAFDYPDYHGLHDDWQKVDYDNMARVDRTIAVALIQIANSSTPPKWNGKNPKTAEFRAAQAKQAR